MIIKYMMIALKGYNYKVSASGVMYIWVILVHSKVASV
jgi:hypothetical protein